MLRRTARLFLRKLGYINGSDHPPGHFPGTVRYWEQRYRDEGTSGLGSYGMFARVKARFVNDYIREHNVRSVVDFGAGDGNQLRLLRVPDYLGLDVSETAIDRLRQQFAGDASKRFVRHGNGLNGHGSWNADLGLSLDVIYHLVEDDIYERYMHDLFTSAQRHVIIYSSNREPTIRISRHVRDRKFSELVEARFPAWRLEQKVRNPLAPLSRSNFFVYRKA